jgi:hypothetical protein
MSRLDNLFRKILPTLLFLMPIFYFSLLWYLDFSQQVLNDDYSDHSLGHALNIEAWLKNLFSERNNFFQYFHPGIWFQFFSWISFKAAILTDANLQKDYYSFFKILNDSTRFYFFSGLFSGIMMGFILWGLKKNFQDRKMFPETFFICALFFINESQPTFSYLKFTNDYFILPVIIMSIYFLSDMNKLEKSLLIQIMVGFLMAFGYLNKLPYIVLYISFVVSVIIITYLTGKTTEKFLRIITITGLSMVFISAFLLITTLNKGIALIVLRSHIQIFLSSGHYGSGEKGIISSEQFIYAITEILNYNPFILLAIISSFIFLIWSFWKNIYFYKKISFRSKNAAFIMLWSLLSFTLGIIAVLKHYDHRYMIMPISSLIPGLVHGFQIHTKLSRYLYLTILFFGLMPSVYKNFLNVQSYKNSEISLTSILNNEMNKNIQAKVIYDYRFPVKEFVQFFALNASGLPDYRKYYPKHKDIIFISSPDLLMPISQEAALPSDLNQFEWDYWLYLDRKNDETDLIKKVLLSKKGIIKKEILPGIILANRQKIHGVDH